MRFIGVYTWRCVGGVRGNVWRCAEDAWGGGVVEGCAGAHRGPQRRKPGGAHFDGDVCRISPEDKRFKINS